MGITELTYYRWRKEYGGMKTVQMKGLKDLERENGPLKKAIAELTLDKLILKEAFEGNDEIPIVAIISKRNVNIKQLLQNIKLFQG